MSWDVQWHIRCDGCGRADSPPGSGSWEAERRALACGWAAAWTDSGKRHLCPACLAGQLPAWWPKEW